MMDSLTQILAFSSFLFYIPLFTAVLCLAIHYLVYSRRVAQWKRSNIPFLKPSFLIGHKYFLNLTKNSCLVSLDRIYRENSDKDVVGFFLGTVPMVLVRSPTLIKQVFARNFDKTFEPGFAGSKNDAVSQNMLNLCADKDTWQSGRKTLSPVFSTSRISGEAFTKITNQIASLWTHAEKSVVGETPVNAKEVSQNFIMDSTSHSFFGVDANSYEKQGELLQLSKNIYEPSVTKMLALYARMQFPGAQEAFESLRHIAKENVDLMKGVLGQQMASKSQKKGKGFNFVDFLISLKEEQKDEKPDSGVDITNQMIGFGILLAAKGDNADTNLANFAIHLLSLHPEYQERIRAEVTAAMEKHKTSEFTYDVVQDLTFTDQCLHETARLFPNVPAIMRVCSEDFTVPGTDYTFKKGERVIMDPYSVHRDPQFFKNANEFNPDRFSPENKQDISPDSYLAFGSGPRKCPGNKLGFLMVASLISSLLHKYEIKPRSHVKQMDASDFTPRSFVNVPRENILVNLVPRENILVNLVPRENILVNLVRSEITAQ